MPKLNCKNLLLLALVATLPAALLTACPFCTVESQTLTEEMETSDAVVLATLLKVEPVEPKDDEENNAATEPGGEFGVVDANTGKARFRIQKILVGKELLKGVEEIEAVFFGTPIEGQRYFIRGVGVEAVDWSIPIPLTDVAVEYVNQLQSLPADGPGRTKHFLQYLEHSDPLLAQDAYDEFARAPYADVVGIADQIDRNKLWQWIESREVSPSHRSLYFTMLGVCGQQEDIARLRKMMLADGRILRAAAEASAAASMGLGGAITLPIVPEMVSMEERRKQLGFNALVGCYLKLTGSKGLDDIDRYFLAEPTADPTKIYGSLIAMRFMAEETQDVPMERLTESMRLVLDKPDFAEQAITDLARWEDWTVLDRLVTMFKEAGPNTYVREPIVAYLDQAAKQPSEIGERANAALIEVEKIDPATVKRARSLLSFGFLGRARSTTATPKPETKTEQATDDTEADKETESDGALNDPGEYDSPSEETIEKSDEETTEQNPEQLEKQEVNTPAETDAVPAKPAVSLTQPSVVITEKSIPKPIDPKYLYSVPLAVAAGFSLLVWGVLRSGA